MQTNNPVPPKLQQAIERGRTDKIFFAEFFLGLQLHDGQKAYLRNANAKINLLIAANRWGKSVLMAVLHIHHCFYKIGIGQGNSQAWLRAAYQTANIAPHSEATEPIFKAILAILRSEFPIPQENGMERNNDCIIGWLLNDKRIQNSKPYFIAYTNGAETIFLSLAEGGTNLQGKKLGLITYDEGGRSARLKHDIDSEIMPRTADLNAKLHIPSTPDMESNSILDHYELFMAGQDHDPGYFSQSGSIADNFYLLRRNPNYIIDEEARLKGNPILRQTLYGEFVFAGAAVFNTADIYDAFADILNAGVRYEQGHRYVIGIDTSMGSDEFVCTVLDVTQKPYDLVRQTAKKGNAQSWQMHMMDLLDLVEAYNHDNNVKIILETWNGESARFYLDMPQWLKMKTKTLGSWRPEGVKRKTNESTLVLKPDILLSLRKLLSNKEIRIPNEPKLVKQLSIYREDDRNIPTDRTISLCLAAWYATDGAPKFASPVFQSTNW